MLGYVVRHCHTRFLVFHAHSRITMLIYFTFHSLYLFDATCSCYYTCLSSLTVVSNDATLGVTGEDTDATAPEIEKVKETPQQIAEWTPNDVF